jgi:DNA-binding response OmpR family regulator
LQLNKSGQICESFVYISWKTRVNATPIFITRLPEICVTVKKLHDMERNPLNSVRHPERGLVAKLLLVEDDKRLCLNIQDWFEHKHHAVESVHDGIDGLALLQFSDFDLIILDINLPGMSGFELCRRFRAAGGKTPILMLTGSDLLIDKEVGFGAGADDYLTKPFHLEELSLRVQALLRRASGAVDNVLRRGILKLDPVTHTVFRGEESVNLSPIEFSLLEFFMRHPKQVFSPETLLNHVWDSGSETSPETVRTWVKRLRTKIDTEGKPSAIRNIHGVGYSFDL